MPQLNPTPWLLFMAASWLLTLTIFKMKTLHATPLNTTTAHDLTNHHTSPWNWPWT